MSSAGSHVPAVRGQFDGAGQRFAIVVSRFNSFITASLLEGAVACLTEHGVSAESIDVVHVPGAWELPQTANRIAKFARHDAILTLGCVIRGQTPHFDYVCSEASSGLGAVARSASMPVLFGVLTTDDEAQARARAGEGKDNKGYETAMAALEMVHVFAEWGDNS